VLVGIKTVGSYGFNPKKYKQNFDVWIEDPSFMYKEIQGAEKNG
jgi:hypothetical protein